MSLASFGIIAPHPPIIVEAVGGRRAEGAQSTIDALSVCAHALAGFAPEAIVIISPHAPALSDAVALDDSVVLEGSLSQFGDARNQRRAGDPALAHAVLAELKRRGIPAVARSEDPRLRPGVLDHAVLVPLSFLDPSMRVPIVVLSLTFLGYGIHRDVGEAVAAAASTTVRRVAFVASGDLSHRLMEGAPAGFSPHGADLDRAIVDIVGRGNLTELAGIDADVVEGGGECGLRSFIALGGFLGDDPVPTRILAYEGPWGVGYLTALAGTDALAAADSSGITLSAGTKGGTAGADESEIVRLARSAIERFINSGEKIASPSLPDSDYPQRAGVFVSLHQDERLRGCIGTILPTRDTLAEEVVANAIEAATKDPRFPPITDADLPGLDIKVDVLHAPESCSISELDPKDYGVIASSGWRRGLLLPDLESVDDVETQVSIAMQKAGIHPGEPCSFERFKVDRYT